MQTGQRTTAFGIYQSNCPCRTALTLRAGSPLPRCLGCDGDVSWRLVRAVDPVLATQARTSSIPAALESPTRAVQDY